MEFNYSSHAEVVDNFLSNQEIEKLLDLIDQLPYVESGTGGDANFGGFNPTTRRSQVKWIPKHDNFRFIYKKIVNHCKQLNEKIFSLNLNDYENIQYTEYTDKDWGTYNWHIDTMKIKDNSYRKLSVVVFLDNETDFTGGNFLIDIGGSIVNIEQKRGNMVVFNSYMSHCVTPIVYGKRKSLVLWLSGPK